MHTSFTSLHHDPGDRCSQARSRWSAPIRPLTIVSARPSPGLWAFVFLSIRRRSGNVSMRSYGHEGWKRSTMVRANAWKCSMDPFQQTGAWVRHRARQAQAARQRKGNTLVTGKATTLDALSEREKAILQRLSAGLSDQQIADELFLSLHTVKWYNHRLDRKRTRLNSSHI